MDNVVSAGGGLGGLLMSIAGAGSGMAHSAEDSISKNQAAELKRIEEDHQAQIAEDKAKALSQFSADYGAKLAEDQRVAATTDIEKNYQGLLHTQQLANWNDKNTLGDNAKADSTDRPATMSDVTNGDVNLATEPDAQVSAHDDAMLRLKAEAQHTGDYSKLASLNNASELAQARAESWRDNMNNKFAMQQLSNEAKVAIAESKSGKEASILPAIQMYDTMTKARDSVPADKLVQYDATMETVKGAILRHPMFADPSAKSGNPQPALNDMFPSKAAPSSAQPAPKSAAPAPQPSSTVSQQPAAQDQLSPEKRSVYESSLHSQGWIKQRDGSFSKGRDYHATNLEDAMKQQAGMQ